MQTGFLKFWWNSCLPSGAKTSKIHRFSPKIGDFETAPKRDNDALFLLYLISLCFQNTENPLLKRFPFWRKSAIFARKPPKTPFRSRKQAVLQAIFTRPTEQTLISLCFSTRSSFFVQFFCSFFWFRVSTICGWKKSRDQNSRPPGKISTVATSKSGFLKQICWGHRVFRLFSTSSTARNGKSRPQKDSPSQIGIFRQKGSSLSNFPRPARKTGQKMGQKWSKIGSQGVDFQKLFAHVPKMSPHIIGDFVSTSIFCTIYLFFRVFVILGLEHDFFHLFRTFSLKNKNHQKPPPKLSKHHEFFRKVSESSRSWVFIEKTQKTRNHEKHENEKSFSGHCRDAKSQIAKIVKNGQKVLKSDKKYISVKSLPCQQKGVFWLEFRKTQKNTQFRHQKHMNFPTPKISRKI